MTLPNTRLDEGGGFIEMPPNPAFERTFRRRRFGFGCIHCRRVAAQLVR